MTRPGQPRRPWALMLAVLDVYMYQMVQFADEQAANAAWDALRSNPAVELVDEFTWTASPAAHSRPAGPSAVKTGAIKSVMPLVCCAPGSSPLATVQRRPLT